MNQAERPLIINKGAENAPYFTPEQIPPAGAAWDPQPEGSLFAPLTLRNMTLKNRIFVSPMCQYSADNGYMTAWHMQHLGSLATRGAGLVMTEVVSVSPEGRISPEDVGIWEDGQIAPMKELVDYVHSQNAKIGIQIGHAGRKASTVAPWLDRKAGAVKEANGWPENVVAPSALAFSDEIFTPRAMTIEDINKFKEDWAAAVKRALAAGFDTLEFHAGHGYLLNQFFSPASNKRTDQYGGSFENRVRILLEIIEITRGIVPEDYPLLVRLAGTDYLEFDPSLEQWTVDDAARLGKILTEKGIDLIDVTGGGLDHRQQIKNGPGYQVPLAAAVKKATEGTNVPVTAVGNITTGTEAESYIKAGSIDAVFVGRPFLKNTSLVWAWAEELNIDIHLPAQYGWVAGNTRTHRPSHRHSHA